MPLRTCGVPGCPEPAVRGGYCAEDAPRIDRERNRAGYHVYRTKRWQTTRRRQLFRHPLCQCDDPECWELATEVDHVVPLEDGGDPWAPDNLASLTKRCHSRKTRREKLSR